MVKKLHIGEYIFIEKAKGFDTVYERVGKIKRVVPQAGTRGLQVIFENFIRGKEYVISENRFGKTRTKEEMDRVLDNYTRKMYKTGRLDEHLGDLADAVIGWVRDGEKVESHDIDGRTA